jgi:hypothetical protein
MPMTEEEVAAKFRDCAAFAHMPADRVEKAIELVLGLEKVDDIRELTALSRKQS